MAYVKALQRSQHGKLDDVPPAQRGVAEIIWSAATCRRFGCGTGSASVWPRGALAEPVPHDRGISGDKSPHSKSLRKTIVTYNKHGNAVAAGMATTPLVAMGPLAAAGFATAYGLGWLRDSSHVLFFHAYLVAYIYFLWISLGALFFACCTT